MHPEVVGIGARAAPPAGGAVNRFVALTVTLQRLVLRTSRPRSVGQRSEFTNNFEMHWARPAPIHEYEKIGGGTSRPPPSRVKTVFLGDGPSPLHFMNWPWGAAGLAIPGLKPDR